MDYCLHPSLMHMLNLHPSCWRYMLPPCHLCPPPLHRLHLHPPSLQHLHLLSLSAGGAHSNNSNKPPRTFLPVVSYHLHASNLSRQQVDLINFNWLLRLSTMMRLQSFLLLLHLLHQSLLLAQSHNHNRNRQLLEVITLSHES